MDFLAAYGTLIIFLISFGNQLGLPLAGELLFLQLGAAMAGGKLGIWDAILSPLLGTVLANLCLYNVGRHSGLKFLGKISQYSLEPLSLGSETKRRFGRWGLKFLLVSQFFPLSWTLPVISGMTRARLLTFYAFSSLGAAVWITSFVAAGYLGRHQIDALIGVATRLVGTLVGVSAMMLAVWIAVKLVRRHRILSVHQRARISPEILKSRIDAGEPILIMDVRNRDWMEHSPYVIPGAFVLPEEQIDARRKEIPMDRELVVYCSCPNELSSARVALKLNRDGLERIHALEGGIDAWRALGFPVEARRPMALSS